MARILISGFDDDKAAMLARLLRLRGHCVDDLHDAQVVTEADRLDQYDLVVVDVSRRSPETDALIAGIEQSNFPQGDRPVLLCVTEVYRGPLWEIELCSKGAHVIYV